MDDLFVKAGQWLANLYIGYGIFFLFGGSVFCLHLAVLIFLGWRRDPRRFRRLILAVEVIYGLVNPAIYLLFLEQPMELHGNRTLRAVGWSVLLAFWGLRLWGGVGRLRGSLFGRRLATVILWAACATVIAFLIKDCTTLFKPSGGLAPFSAAWWLGALSFINVAALYAIPALAAIRMLRLAKSDATWSEGESFFLLSPRFAIASSTVLVLGAALLHLPASARTAERRVLAQRSAILDAASRYQLEPRLIASVLYVITREHAAPFARQLERFAMAAWLADPRNDMGFAVPLDLSIGIAQIRPLTALGALEILDASAAAGDAGSEAFSSTPALDSAWRLPAPAVAALRPSSSSIPPKPEMVERLFDDRGNIEMCALILALYAIQWESANPAWSIRDRPEILATLYQLGFERSRPKANPKPIAFGERVRSVYESPWMKESFPSP